VRIDPADLVGLPAALASDRFGTYLRACRGDRRGAIRLYTWNVEVSAALLGPMHLLEIVLRNSLHERLVEWTGQEMWWRHVRLVHP
jgi:hypothetical protein